MIARLLRSFVWSARGAGLESAHCIGYGIGSLREAPIAAGGVCGTSIIAAPGGKAWSKNLRNQLAQSRGSVNDRTDGLAGGIAGEAACSFAS
jgi:hypothetical protein